VPFLAEGIERIRIGTPSRITSPSPVKKAAASNPGTIWMNCRAGFAVTLTKACTAPPGTVTTSPPGMKTPCRG